MSIGRDPIGWISVSAQGMHGHDRVYVCKGVMLMHEMLCTLDASMLLACPMFISISMPRPDLDPDIKDALLRDPAAASLIADEMKTLRDDRDRFRYRIIQIGDKNVSV